jgi:hypothetical protein
VFGLLVSLWLRFIEALTQSRPIRFKRLRLAGILHTFNDHFKTNVRPLRRLDFFTMVADLLRPKKRDITSVYYLTSIVLIGLAVC